MKDPKILGIDEAGRGCVMGPLCLAGIVLRGKKDASLAQELGCQDSKIFGSGETAKKERARIADELKKSFPHFVEIIPAYTLDQYVTFKSLNQAEIDAARKILSQADFDQAYLDGQNLFKPLTGENVFSENKADQNHLSVAAASIIAKDRRDAELEKIYCGLGLPETTPGGGYANAQTLRLMIEFHGQHGKLPDDYRKSFRWRKLEELIAGKTKG